MSKYDDILDQPKGNKYSDILDIAPTARARDELNVFMPDTSGYDEITKNILPEVNINASRVKIDPRAHEQLMTEEYNRIFQGRQPYSIGYSPEEIQRQNYLKNIVGALEKYTPVYSNIKSSVEGVQQGVQDIQSGNPLGIAAGIAKGGFGVANITNPGLALFNEAIKQTEPVIGEKGSQYLFAPVTTLTNPATDTGKYAAELGDIISNLVLFKLAEAGAKRIKKRMPIEEIKEPKISKTEKPGTTQEQLKERIEVKDAVQERRPEEEIPRVGEAGENIPPDSERIRQSEQGKETTGIRERENLQETSEVNQTKDLLAQYFNEFPGERNKSNSPEVIKRAFDWAKEKISREEKPQEKIISEQPQEGDRIPTPAGKEYVFKDGKWQFEFKGELQPAAEWVQESITRDWLKKKQETPTTPPVKQPETTVKQETGRRQSIITSLSSKRKELEKQYGKLEDLSESELKNIAQIESTKNNLLDLRDEYNSKHGSERNKIRKQINAEIQKLRSKGIDASFESGKILINNETLKRKPTYIPPEDISNIQLKEVAEKPFKELDQETIDKQTIVAENLVDVDDLPRGFGERALEKAREDVKNDKGRETSTEAKLLRDAAEQIIEKGKTVQPATGVRNAKQFISPDEVQRYIDEKIEEKAKVESGEDTSFEFGENVRKETQPSQTVVKTAAGDQPFFSGEMAKPVINLEKEIKTAKAKNEEGTPLFSQEQEIKGQEKLFEEKKEIPAKAEKQLWEMTKDEFKAYKTGRVKEPAFEFNERTKKWEARREIEPRKPNEKGNIYFSDEINKLLNEQYAKADIPRKRFKEYLPGPEGEYSSLDLMHEEIAKNVTAFLSNFSNKKPYEDYLTYKRRVLNEKEWLKGPTKLLENALHKAFKEGKKENYNLSQYRGTSIGQEQHKTAVYSGAIKEPAFLYQSYEESFFNEHKAAILQAINEGKIVPENVLNEYPDIKAGSTKKYQTGLPYIKQETKTSISHLPVQPKIKSEFKESDLNDVSRLRDIGKNLTKELEYETGKTVRTGTKLLRRFSPDYLGVYFPGSGIVRLKNINDLAVLAHEIGHKLDTEIFQLTSNISFKKNIKAEGVITRLSGIRDPVRREKALETLRKKYGAAFVDAVLERTALRKELKDFTHYLNHYSDKTKEGIAEFISKFVTEPELVRKLTPKFNNLFENILDQQPVVRTALLNAREQIKKFSSQDPRQITESTIHREKPSNTWIAGIKKAFSKEGFVYNVIDNVQPFRDLEKELLKKNPTLTGDKNPLQQVLSLLGVDGKAKQFLENHPFRKKENDIEILTDKKGFFEIFHKMLKEGTLKSHEGYLTALRNLELYKNHRGEAATTTKDIANKTVKLYEEQFSKEYLENLVNDLREYNNALLEYYKISGKISADQLDKIKEMNQYYVPFKRFFDEWESSGNMPNVSKYVKDIAPSPVKTIHGSMREINSPIGSMIKNTYDIIAAADRNTTLKNIVSSLRTIDKSLVQEIPPRIFKKVRVIAEKKIDPFTGEVIEPESFTELKTAVEYKKPENAEIVTVWDDGSPTYYQIPKTYYDSFFSLNEQVGKAIRLFSLPSRILQAGAVSYDPTFAVRNIPRDQISALFYSKYGYQPFDFLRGILPGIGKNEIYQKFLASGADQSFLTAMDKMLSKSYVETKVGERIETTFQKYKHNPLEALQDLNRATELGTRIGAFRKAYLKTGDVYKAMQEGREVSADYGVKGKAMNSISPLYPFLNARLQHAKMGVLALKNSPKKTLAKGTMFVTAPAIINWLANNLDEDRRKIYDELPHWRKYGFFNIPIPGTESFLPIPKGFFGQLFGTSAEGLLDWIKKNNPETIKDLTTQLFSEISPFSSWVDIVPQAGRPIIEQFANKKGYTGKPIVSEKLKNLEPADQYTEINSHFSRFIGSLLGLSPARIDAFLTGYTAGTGKNVLEISDDLLELLNITNSYNEDTFTKLSHFPVLKAFITEVPQGTRGESVQKFYEKLDELEEINKTVNKFIKDGYDEDLEKYLNKHKSDYSYYISNQLQINRFHRTLKYIKQLRTDLMKDPKISDKREKIKNVERIITEIAVDFQDSYKQNKPFDMGIELNSIIQTYSQREKLDRKRIKEFKAKNG